MTLYQILFLIASCLLLVFIVIKEIRVTSKVPLTLRLLAGLLALGSLTLLTLPLKFPSSAKPGADELFMFTRGTPDSILRTWDRRGTAVTTDTIIARRHGIPLAEDWQALLDNHPDATPTIYGYGPTRGQLASIEGRPFRYDPPAPPEGFIAAQWPQLLQAASPLAVHGQYHNPADREVKILLLSAGQAVDSVRLQGKGVHMFALRHPVKQLGKTVLQLAAVSGSDTLQREKVPVTIDSPKSLKVALLASSPSFEYKFLGSWFQELRYHTVSRVRISTDKFSWSHSEEPPFQPDAPLAKGNLEAVDLLIADDAELAALPPAEQQAIAAAVRSGMGLLLFLDSTRTHSRLGREFRLAPAPAASARQASLTSSARHEYPGLRPGKISAIQAGNVQEPLLYLDSRPVAVSQLYGKGRITGVTLKNTYTWWLRGQQTAYAQYWSFLIDRTTGARQRTLRIQQTPRYPAVHEWTELTVHQPADTTIAINGRPYPRLQHPHIPDLFEVSFWPTNPGWHQVATAADTAWHYVYDKPDWQTAKDHETMNALTHLKHKNQVTADKKTGTTAKNARNKSLDWLFFCIFLASASVLWYASRHYNQNVI